MKRHVRCTYLRDCYLAEELQCYGFRTDCPLYMKSNGEPCNEARFHAAMDRLIMRTKEKHDRLKGATSAPDAQLKSTPESASGK